jgi:hypothetical protein
MATVIPELFYRNAGDSILASDMNTLFFALDAKATLALDDHSILFLLGEFRDTTLDLMGPYLDDVFVWASGSQRISGYWGNSHAGLTATPLKSFRQAELVLDGVTSIDIPHDCTWRFFRAHNCNSIEASVNFKNAAGASESTLRIPPYASRCTRRVGSDGEYTYIGGFNYFQFFAVPDVHDSEDVRLYQHNTCNNVANPSILIPFVNHMLAGRVTYLSTDGGHGAPQRIAMPTVFLDPHVRAPLPTVADPEAGESRPYADLYAAVSDNVKLLDVLYHKGDIVEVNATGATAVTLSFNGYSSLASILSVQQVGTDLQIRSKTQRDLLALSSNLFCCASGMNHIAHPVIDGSAWFTLSRHTPALQAFRVVASESSEVVTYREYGANGALGATVTVPVPRVLLSFDMPAGAVNTGSVSAPVWLSNLGLLDTLDTVKNRYTAPNENSRFTNTVSLTSSGLAVNSTQSIDSLTFQQGSSDRVTTVSLGYELGNALGNYLIERGFEHRLRPARGSHLISIDADGTIKRAFPFIDYGWPNVDDWFYTGFLTPRVTRMYSDCPRTGVPVGGIPSSGPHPDFKEGGEYDAEYLGDKGMHETAISILSPWNAQNYYFNGVMGIMNNNDVILGATKGMRTAGYWTSNRSRLLSNVIAPNSPRDGSDNRFFGVGMYRFWRMEMAVEHFNNLVAKVKSMERYKPLNWVDHGVVKNGNDNTQRIRILPSQMAGGFGIGASFSAGDPWNGQSIIPKDFYCHTSQYTRANAIPEKGIADLPAAYAEARVAKPSLVRVTGKANAPIYTTVNDASFGPMRSDLAALTEFPWITCGQMKTFAEGLGYKFLYANFGVPLRLEKFEIGQPSVTLCAPDNNPNIDFTYQRRFFEFVNQQDGEWLLVQFNNPFNTTPAFTITVTDRPPCDMFRVGAGGLSLGVPDVPARLRHRLVQGYNRAGGATGGVYACTKFPLGAVECTSVQAHDWSSTPGLLDVRQFEINHVTNDDNFSQGGANAAKASLNNQSAVFPFRAANARRAQCFVDFTTAF